MQETHRLKVYPAAIFFKAVTSHGVEAPIEIGLVITVEQSELDPDPYNVQDVIGQAL